MSTSTATTAHAFKAAMVTAARTLYAGRSPEVLVSYGHWGPAVKEYLDAVAFTTVQVEQDPATYGTNRAREETLSLTVVFSSWRPDAADDEVPGNAAYDLLELLERHVRVTDTTLGGVVRQCFLVSHFSEGETDVEQLVNGRTVEVEAVFQAKVRITG